MTFSIHPSPKSAIAAQRLCLMTSSLPAEGRWEHHYQLPMSPDLEPAVKMSSDVGLLLRPKGDSNLLGGWRKSWRGEMRRKRCKFNHVSMMMSWQQGTSKCLSGDRGKL